MRARLTQQSASPDAASHIVTLKNPVDQRNHTGQTIFSSTDEDTESIKTLMQLFCETRS